MLVLAIWLFLIGYTVAITGKRNLGVNYAPQADGSIKAVDDQGNPAKTYSLLDVVTCAGGKAAAGVQPTAPSASSSSSSSSNPITGDCRPQPKDVRLPGGMIWREFPAHITIAGRTIKYTDHQLVGPC